MVIRIKLFIHRPCQTEDTFYFVVHQCINSYAVPIRICLAGLVDEKLDPNYHGNWVWVGFEIVPSSLQLINLLSICVIFSIELRSFSVPVMKISWPSSTAYARLPSSCLKIALYKTTSQTWVYSLQ